eukprot:GHVR01086527.1.p1 GENE.GHVR01086527.1~~GHVR01086527.1.p1  ORF type:complete len:150 (-),score=29.91 GHVR01086527.1:587-1036(-)
MERYKVNSSEIPPPVYKHRKTSVRVYEAKKEHRSDIKPSKWSKYQYANSNVLQVLQNDVQVDTIDRVHKDDITVSRFIEEYEKPGRPVILQGFMDDWPAMTNWDTSNLLKLYRNGSYKVGEDDKVDDSPLYLFEPNCEEYTKSSDVIND